MNQPWLPDRLPEDIDAERALLCTLCAPGAEEMAARLLPQLHPKDFVHPAHRDLWAAAQTVISNGDEINLLTLKDALVHAKTIGKVGGFVGLTEILMGEEVGRPERLVALLKEKRAFREMIHIASDLARAAAGQDADRDQANPSRLSQEFVTRLLALQGGEHGDSDITTFLSAAHKALANEALMPESESSLVRFGLSTVDNELSGWPGSLGVLCGKTSAGKTSLAVQGMLMSQMPFFLSMEMSDAEIEARALANITGANSRSLLRGDYRHAVADLSRLMEQETLDRLDQCRKLTRFRKRDITSICSKIEAVVRRFGVRTVFLDYLTLMEPNAIKGASIAYMVGQMSTMLKGLMGDLGTAGVVLAQLNRGVKDGERIQLEHLRESGQIEQDATWVMSLYTEKPRYEPHEVRMVNVELLKNRNGARFLRSYASFEPWNARFVQVERTTGPAKPAPAAAPGPDAWDETPQATGLPYRD